MDKQLPVSAFKSQAERYIYEYAKPLNPANLAERKFGYAGFGHAGSILDAVAQRKKFARRLQAAAAGLTETELRAIQSDLAATFAYDKVVGDQRRLVTDYYDRANVAELLEEAVQIALGNPARAKSVYTRFEDRPPAPLKAQRPNYDAMMRGAHFDI